MINRLKELNVIGVPIETFNSFCEKILKKHSIDNSRIITFNEKIKLVLKSIENLNLNFNQISESYFTSWQRKNKNNEELLLSFVNDCFYVLDHFKNERKEINEFYLKLTGLTEKKNAKYLHQVCTELNKLMSKKNLRDYSDQLNDAITLFEKDKSIIPKFEHILIDEYQDVNSIQIMLLDLLNPKNIFAVGDPRQAIFGWRGSKIDYILNFKDACNIVLKENFRSHSKIIDTANKIIKDMGINNQKTGLNKDTFNNPCTKLFNFNSEQLEREFVVREIINSNISKEEIFILARTNKQLKKIDSMLKNLKIPTILKTDDNNGSELKKGHITLATIHAIKGLEAKVVFLIGCNSLYFPCKVSDHPVLESLNFNNYDKEDEEKRLLYVAITRAKEQLYISYTGKSPSIFLTKEIRDSLGSTEYLKPIPKEVRIKFNGKSKKDVYSKLKDWRFETSSMLGVPAYMILNNKTIEEISGLMPIKKEELYSIYGLGPSKISKYGDKIIEIVNN